MTFVVRPKLGLQLLLTALMFAAARPAQAIPAFARKYGLPCSACHEAWPKLNNFGQTFRDNGYQLNNDRDAPIYQEPAYFPITFRTTPQWHREHFDRVPLDNVPGSAASGQSEQPLRMSGFDLTGIDIFAAGTLYKNISFALQPFLDTTGRLNLQTAWIRLDNLFGSRWLNFKFGKFELDTLVSERRILTLDNSGFYHSYHFVPPGDVNIFGGLSNNQLGIELLGHSANGYRRYSVAMLSTNNGAPNLPDSNTYDVYADFTQAFDIPHLGTQRFGAYGYLGKSPTFFQTSSGFVIPGTGSGNRSYWRAGAYALWYLGKFDLTTFYLRGQDNVFLGNGVRADQPENLPAGAAGPNWNAGFGELHYTYNPRLILIARGELVKMARQPNPAPQKNFGNQHIWTVGYRWYPFMSSRAGLAWVQEYSHTRTIGTAPISGLDENASSYLMGFDFDF